MTSRATKNGLFRYGDGWGFRVTFRDPLTRQRREIKRQSQKWTQKQARQAMLEAQVEAEAAQAFGSSKQKVSDYLRSWVEARERIGRLKPTTEDTIRRHVEAYLVPRLGEIRLADLKPAMLERVYGDLLSEGSLGKAGRPMGEGLSPKTVRNVAGTLHKALSDAVKKGIIASNPADQADLPRWDRPEIKIWDSETALAFLAWSYGNGDEMFPLWLLAFSTGLRRGEVLGLRWEKVDLVSSTVTIDETRVLTRGRGVIVSSPKTKAGIRSLVIDPYTRDTLALLKDKQEVTARRFGFRVPDLVASDLDGKAIHPTTLTRRFQRAIEQAGADEIRLHDLRHTHASMLLDAGESLVVVSGRLGHSRPSTTSDVYGHAMPSAHRDLATRWGDRLEHGLVKRLEQGESTRST